MGDSGVPKQELLARSDVLSLLISSSSDRSCGLVGAWRTCFYEARPPCWSTPLRGPIVDEVCTGPRPAGAKVSAVQHSTCSEPGAAAGAVHVLRTALGKRRHHPAPRLRDGKAPTRSSMKKRSRTSRRSPLASRYACSPDPRPPTPHGRAPRSTLSQGVHQRRTGPDNQGESHGQRTRRLRIDLR